VGASSVAALATPGAAADGGGLGGAGAVPPAAAGVAVYPEDLLDQTGEVVDAVRADVTAVVAAWASGVGQLATAERRLAELAATAERLGLVDTPEIAAAQAAVHAHANACAADPLSTDPADLAAAVAAVDEADALLAVLARARGSLAGDLHAAEMLLADVRAAAAEADRLASRAAQRVIGAAAVPAAPDEGWLSDPHNGLRPWLRRLTDLADRGDWPAAARGLLAWRAAAQGALVRARETAEANAAPLRRRDELRGLLGALHAKAAADGSAEDPDLVALHRRAHDALYVAPSDLELAADLVHRYTAGLVVGTGGGGGREGGPRDTEEA
jgi:hypothetical protein